MRKEFVDGPEERVSDHENTHLRTVDYFIH